MRLRFFTGGVCGTVCVLLCACGNSNNSPAAASDAAPTDTGTTEAAPTDSAATEAAPADSGATDAAPDVACTPTAPPSGFTVVDPGTVGGGGIADRGDQSIITTDEDGSPMIAYLRTQTSSVDVNFIRWVRGCTSHWSTPIVVGSASGITDSRRGLSIAYDSTTKTVGIAYRARITGASSETYQVHVATLASGATTFTDEIVDSHSSSDASEAENAAILMAKGTTYVVWEEENGGGTSCARGPCDTLLLRQKQPGDTAFRDATTITNESQIEINSLSIAIDSAGALGVAWAASPDGVNTVLRYARPSTSPATLIDFHEGTSDPSVVLAYAGLKPRMAAYLKKPDWATTAQTLWVIGSDDDKTFSTPIAVPLDGGNQWGNQLGMVLDPAGNMLISANIEGSTSPPGAFGIPKWARTPDLTSFTLGGAPAATYNADASWLSIALGADGKANYSFQKQLTDSSSGLSIGLVYYRN